MAWILLGVGCLFVLAIGGALVLLLILANELLAVNPSQPPRYRGNAWDDMLS